VKVRSFPWFFETLQSRYEARHFGVRSRAQAHERRSRESETKAGEIKTPEGRMPREDRLLMRG